MVLRDSLCSLISESVKASAGHPEANKGTAIVISEILKKKASSWDVYTRICPLLTNLYSNKRAREVPIGHSVRHSFCCGARTEK